MSSSGENVATEGEEEDEDEEEQLQFNMIHNRRKPYREEDVAPPSSKEGDVAEEASEELTPYVAKCYGHLETLRKRNSWKPNTADPTPAGSYDLVIKRTKYGLVTWRGMVNGVPTAFTTLRSTYLHEADSAIGFQMFNDPDEMGSASGFMNAASKIGFAFNWFYVNSREAAYFTSADIPVPVSLTATMTYCPGTTSRWPAA